jgi:hypothetical protein
MPIDWRDVGGKKEVVESFVVVLCGFKLWSISLTHPEHKKIIKPPPPPRQRMRHTHVYMCVHTHVCVYVCINMLYI